MRKEDFVGKILALAVEAVQDTGQGRLDRIILGLPGRHFLGVSDLAPPHEKDIEGQLLLIPGQPENVGVFESHGDELRPFLDLLYGADEVAPITRLLVVEARRGVVHPLPEGFQQLAGPSLQEEKGVGDIFPVLGFSYRPDAGRRAQLEVMLQTGPPALSGYAFLAAADAEVPVQQVDGLAGLRGGAERSEIAGAVILDFPGQDDSGESLADGQLEIRKAFVVLEPEVELGLVALDEIVL